eukprot:TRINITY_DN73757_c0_g1_i1.p1 TRINITY_DN73757_c0_g1~~TRINITY_DN73757_c0_g1_i1.p1  ORF type:complete len:237 (-),score=19.24 TRINITY_DN73757_c0_g1_i1:127-813(-)
MPAAQTRHFLSCLCKFCKLQRIQPNAPTALARFISGKPRKENKNELLQMKKSTKTELNKFLKEMSKKELEAEVKKLYNKFKEVKKYYEIELSGDTTEILNEFKQKIRDEYFPKRGFGKARNRESRKVVNDFKKISIFQKDVVELLLYRVETMITFTSEYGDINEPFYNSLESSFEEACKLIKQEKLEKEYRGECRRLMNETYHFGWGLYDGMKYSYDTYFSEQKNKKR